MHHLHHSHVGFPAPYPELIEANRRERFGSARLTFTSLLQDQVDGVQEASG